MNKLLYMLTAFMMATSVYSFADEDAMCPEGQDYDPETFACVEIAPPAEMPSEAPSE